MPSKPTHPPAVRALAVEQVVTGQAHAKDVAEALGVSPATITRWVERARRQPPPPPSAAELVAKHAPPPAAPAPPPAPLEDTSIEGMIAELGALVGRHKDAARRAAAIGDAEAERKALTSAGAAMVEIRKLRSSQEGGAGTILTLTADGLEAMRAELRRRWDELAAAGPPRCHDCGRELRAAWAAEDVTPVAPGGVTRDGDGARGAS